KITVVCTTSLLGEFVEKIGKDRLEVTAIVPQGICPAHYDIKPGDVQAVIRASLVFSHGMESWLENLIKVSRNETLKKIKIKGEWDSPALVVKQLELITEALCEVSPSDADYFEENRALLVNSINEAARRIKNQAEELNLGQVKVLCIKWQEDFVRWLGLDVVATYPPPERISLKQVLELTKKGEEKEVSLIIDNLQSGTDFGAKLASQIGATQVVLTNFPGVPEAKDYVEMIEYNSRQIFSGIKRQNEK
ncbi:MAG: metal ABC transporter substrate-binding protein, partial [Candidatus Aerophobetes bacterium]|nr:metal ABC transporter substrate-binding protein [Candidatus Aerophobetes bacterium]